MKRQAAKARDLTSSKQKLAKRQKGRCRECGESLFNDEELQSTISIARSLEAKTTTAILYWFISSAINKFMRRPNGRWMNVRKTTTEKFSEMSHQLPIIKTQ